MGDDPKKRDPKEGQFDSKRVAPRVDFFNRVHVLVPDDNTSIDVFASNVSRGGMFLRSNRPLPKGKKITLEFETKNGPVRVDESEVVWNKPFDPINVDGKSPGMGVQFRNVSSDARQKIESFITESLEEQSDASKHNPPSPTVFSEQPKAEPAFMQLPILAAAPPSSPILAAPLPQPTSSPFLPPGPVALTSTPPHLADRSQKSSNVSQPENTPGATAVQQEPKPAGPTSWGGPVSSSGEVPMNSVPPPPKTRIFLLTGFVILVAVATFATLYAIQPISGNTEPESDPTANAPVQPAPPTAQPPLAAAVPAAAAETQSPVPSPAPVPASSVPTPAPSAPTPAAPSPTPPAVAVPSPAQPAAPPPAPVAAPSVAPPAASPAVPTVKKPEPVTASSPKNLPPAPPAPGSPQNNPAAETAQVDVPTFENTGNAWTLVIKSSAPLKIKSFPLKSPPRLAIDFEKASFIGKRLVLDAPTPFISRIRVGKQEGFVRFVLDFGGAEIPAHQIKIDPDRLTIVFNL
jgi:molecular chaperone DnaK